jgi:hypothetical protein
MLSDQEKRDVLEQVNREVDEVFLRLYGRTYREPTTSTPSSNGDSLGQIQHDFKALFKP